MKIALLNMPNAWPVMRRYMCSTRAESYLFPPQELMYLAAIAEKDGHKAKLLDAIAEKKGFDETAKELQLFAPDLIATITGFECFENDMGVIQKIKEMVPSAKTLCFGYYPTIFPKEIMQKTNIDFLILGEPELVFSELAKALSKGADYSKIVGLACRKKGRIIVNEGTQRILDIDSLPLPSHRLLKQGPYSEPFMVPPYTTIQSSRGCPFQCNYCVSTYGKQPVFRSSESILLEIKLIRNELGIRNFRFIDDTFTVNKVRVMELCEKIVKNRLGVNWTCLSRVDTLDRQLLAKMKEAGCKRIFLGIESGSQNVLQWFKKGYKAEQLQEKIRAVHESGIESLGFFIVGSPPETEQDFQKSIDLAKASKLDYVVVSRLLAYPGTPLFEQMKHEISFSLFPYKNKFKDTLLEEKWAKLEKRFYREFYLRPTYIMQRLAMAIKNPAEFFSNAKRLVYYLLKPSADENRQDLF